MSGITTGRADAIARAGRALAAARARRDSLPPLAAAREAHLPGGPPVDAIAARIAADRSEASAA